MEKELTYEQQVKREEMYEFLKRAEREVSRRELGKEDIKDYHKIEIHVYDVLEDIVRILNDFKDKEQMFELKDAEIYKKTMDNEIIDLLDEYIELQNLINEFNKSKRGKELKEKFEDLKKELEDLGKDYTWEGDNIEVNLEFDKEDDLKKIQKLFEEDIVSFEIEGTKYRFKDIKTNIEEVRKGSNIDD